MLKLTLRNLRANATRLVATAVAIVSGTGFVAAALMLTTALGDAVAGNVNQQYAAVDVAVGPAAGQDQALWSSVPEDTLDLIRSIEGVEAAAGEMLTSVQVLDSDGDPVRTQSLGRPWSPDDELNPLTIELGRAPEGTDEVVVDAETAEVADIAVGDTISLATPTGEREVELVGISRFGRAPSLDTGGTISFAEDAVVEVFAAGEKGWDNIIVRGSGDPEALANRILLEIPPSLGVLSGDEFREAQVADTQEFLDFLSPVLLGFGFLALFVAGFVIYNTFTVVVTERSREIALVRSIGGTPAQVRRSLLAEGALLGVVASLGGLLLGAVIALTIQAVLDYFDIPLPGSGVTLNPRIVLITVVAGTVITAVSVFMPAVRAGRTKPVEAMRLVAVDHSGTSRARRWIGGGLLVVALALLGSFRFVSDQWWLLAPGALALFIGIVVGGPLLARLFGRGAHAVLRRSLTGRIAADNLVRNPKRTSTTANALVIGLFLVTFVTVSGTALRDWVNAEVSSLSNTDFIIQGISPISDELVADVEAVDGVERTAAVRIASVTSVDGQIAPLAGVDLGDLEVAAGFSVDQGSLDEVVAGRGAAVSDFQAMFAQPAPEGTGTEGTGTEGTGTEGTGTEGTGTVPPDEVGPAAVTESAAVGDVLTLLDPDGNPVDVAVVATFQPELDTIFLSTIVNEELFEEIAGTQPVTQLFIRADPSRMDEVGRDLERTLKGYTGIEVTPGNFIGQLLAQIIDFLIAAVNGLLLLSVAIAAIGIVNTMYLSIHERRREFGMVRALGMTADQVRNMVTVEAILMGLLGTIVGTAAGVLLGGVVVGGLTDSGIAVAWGRVGLIFGVGVLISLLASIFPAHRAVRLRMLEAMAS